MDECFLPCLGKMGMTAGKRGEKEFFCRTIIEEILFCVIL